MQAIFDGLGRTVAWLHESGVVHDLNGAPMAFINGRAVYDYAGNHKAWFHDGFFRDGHGDAVAFMRGCRGGPLPPLPELPPIPPLRSLAPLKPLTGLPGLPPLSTLNWSGLTWEELMELD